MSRISIAVTLAALVTLTLPSAALADALACFADGKEALGSDDFAGAAEAFRAAADRAECATTRGFLLFNAAVALDKRAAQAPADDDTPACDALRAYRAAAAEADAATRPTIDEGLLRLGPACPPAGALKIVCEPTGGTVQLDGLHRSRPCPAQFDDLRPRTYQGTATAAGRVVPFSVAVPAGQRVEHRVVFQREEPGPVPPPVADGPRLAPFGWAAVGLGALGAGLATYAYIEGGSLADEQTELNRAYVGQPASADAAAAYARESDRIAGDYDTWETVHAASVIGAGVLLAGGITLLLLDEGPAVDGQINAASGSRAQVFVGPMSGVRISFGP